MAAAKKSFWQSNLVQGLIVIMIAIIGAVFAYGQLTNQQSVTSQDVISLSSRIDKQEDLMRVQIKEVKDTDIKQTIEITRLSKSIDSQTILLERLNDRINESRQENSETRKEIREDFKALRETVSRIVVHSGD